MALQQERYFRRIVRSVMGLCEELESGVIERAGCGRVFDPTFINYRLDVEKALKRLPSQESKVVLLVHRDGLSHADAVRQAGFTSDRPDALVATIEVRAGRLFERLKLHDLVGYIKRDR